MNGWWFVVTLLATNTTTALSVAAINRHATRAATLATKEFQATLGIAHAEFGRLVILLDRLDAKFTAGLDRLEEGAESDRETAAGVAEDLAESKVKLEGVAESLAEDRIEVKNVADDLARGHERADETDGPHGAASDAAARSDPNER